MSSSQNPISSVATKVTKNQHSSSKKDDAIAAQWRLLGRYRVDFVRDMKRFASCPANIFYWEQDPLAYAFASDIQDAMSEAGWNVTLRPDPKKLEGIKIVSRSNQLHAEEISSVVAHLRGLGFETKVRVRPELETESVQIAVGAKPNTA